MDKAHSSLMETGPTVTTSLTGGFSSPVFESQTTFRALMDCMARPGSVAELITSAAPPPPLGPLAGALALTLCDSDTPVWLQPAYQESGLGAWLSFHCGASTTVEKTAAHFAFVSGKTSMPTFAMFATGQPDYPDRSTTLILEVEALEGGETLTLTGPGILDEITIAPLGLPPHFLQQWQQNHALFPRGVDVVLCTKTHMLALPRSCSIALERKEA